VKLMPSKDENGQIEYNDDKTTKMKKKLFIREFWVYNVAQIDKLPAKFTTELEIKEVNIDEKFQEWVKATGAIVAHGVAGYEDNACYIPAVDRICMPKPSFFDTVAHYQATLCHELVHWTGAKKRLDRDLKSRFHQEAYAAEELVAELGAAFACADHGVDGNLRHADYIGHWIKLLRNDPRAIFTASSKASQAVKYLHELTGRQEAAPEAVDELEMAA
jgi:antirestriction protein ArdC